MRPLRALLISALCVLATREVTAADAPLSPAAYRQQLEQIRSANASGNTQEAADLSAKLMNARVRYGGETLPVDRSVLEPISEKNAGKSSARLSQLIDELARMDGTSGKTASTDGADTDQELLKRLRASEDFEGPKKSGELDNVEAKLNKSFVGDIVDFLKSVMKWLGECIISFIKWLGNLFRGRSLPEGDPSSLLPFVVMFLLICLGIIALVLLTIWRQNRARQVPVAMGSTVMSSTRDADPLSRNANEWEVYASDLARQGKFREAIRAWYHAVLVTLYRGGVLHYRKGATNWEYCSTLSPRFAWRPSFVELTRQFEREWYGQHSSSSQTCDEYSGLAREVLTSARKAGEA